MQSADYSAIPESVLPELNRQGESCLQGTVQLAIANDQRAVTLTGMFGAASGAVLAFLGAVLSNSHQVPVAFLAAAISAAVILFAAAVLCAMSAKPADFFVVGYEPKLLSQGCDGDSLAPLLRAALADLQKRIDYNRNALEQSAKMLGLGLRTGVLALPLSLLIFIAFSAGLPLS